MSWTSLDYWIVVTAMLAAVSCALLGNFLVLRRLSMMGDAISHAVLPGLAIAFLATGSRDSLTMLFGAAVVGMITAVATQWIADMGRVDSGASMGIVFTVLFAIGLILIVRGADHVDLDPGCVLYGAIELVPLDTRPFWPLGEVPRAVVTLAGVLGIDVLFVWLFYKELKITAFDGQLATAVGISERRMHYVLMTLVAVTTVAAFESVGSILVIAMLIVPAATARLLSDRLAVMILLSLVIAALCAVAGHAAAIMVPPWFGYSSTSTAGMMAVVAGVIFAAAVIAAPGHGVLSQIIRRLSLGVRVAQEDVLGMLYRVEELGDQRASALAPAVIRSALAVGSVTAHLALWRLKRSGKVELAAAAYRLTVVGREAARGLIRAHRLWETYLVKHLNLPADHVHTPATRLEHITDLRMQQRLADRTGQPRADPQGKRIPDPSGD